MRPPPHTKNTQAKSKFYIFKINVSFAAYEMQCTIEGLECLNDNYNNLAVLKASWSNRSGLVCECLPSCTELEIELVRDIKTGLVLFYFIL